MAVRTSNEALGSECERLRTLVGKKASSIWTMNKAELVETARKELGWTLSQCEKETVTTLRERIRSVRHVCQMTDDPLAKVPTGLEKMKVDELKIEIMNRSLPEPSPCTRAQMICMIRDDVAMRTTLTTEAAASTKSNSESGQDWEMLEANRATRRRN